MSLDALLATKFCGRSGWSSHGLGWSDLDDAVDFVGNDDDENIVRYADDGTLTVSIDLLFIDPGKLLEVFQSMVVFSVYPR